MGLTMSDEREFVLRSETSNPSHDRCPDHWADCNWAREAAVAFAAELDALRARAAELERELETLCAAGLEVERALAAREAECVELRQVGEAMRVAVSTGGRYQAACEAFIAALSRPPGGTEALRAMLAKAVKKSWDGAMEYATGGQFDSLTDVEAEGIVSRLLGEPEEGAKG